MIQKNDVVEHLAEEGVLTGRDIFMTVMACGIAILDLAALRQSVISLAIGIAVALGTSFLIVLISPLTENTSEILARARPNFFDLLVAVFSGFAGGYAVIHRKGETIVGVAIAAELAKSSITSTFAGEFRATGNTPADRETAARRTDQVLIRPAG